ncbi:MAG TPA: response regulator [Bacteroidota bacterium]|nr:response regulator [Bacteroidota bacterium]
MKPTSERRAIRVLIAEDETIVAADLGQRLQSLGYPIVGIVSNGEDAVHAAFDAQPDVVLMDVRLKGRPDGMEAAQRIREMGGPPVVFATAYSDKDTLMQARAARPYGYILKPFQDDAIRATIEIAVCRWNSEREITQREQLLRLTMNAIAEGVIAVDGSMLVTFMNPAAEKMTGRELGEALTSPIWTILDLYGADGSALQQASFTREAEEPFHCLLKNKDEELVGVRVQRLSFEKGGAEEPATVFVVSGERESVRSPNAR